MLSSSADKAGQRRWGMENDEVGIEGLQSGNFAEPRSSVEWIAE
jgi:hypothetical protein